MKLTRLALLTSLAAAVFGVTDARADDYVVGGYDSGLIQCDDCDTPLGGGSGVLTGNLLRAAGDADEPFEVFGGIGDWSVGGWVSAGYHNNDLPLLFNNRDHEFQVHQAWAYAENVADGSCGFDIGGRIDYVYGTDGPDTQAFGIDNDHWDNGWDNGPDYGHALPQVYGEVAYGDMSVKIGHFYTIIGYEVVQATGNFFYSHAYTFFNSEPFTHTGVLGTFEQSEFITHYLGYVMGWDSGFEDNGDAILGGSSLDLTCDINVTGTFIAGTFGSTGSNRENGFMGSLVTSVQLTEPLSYVLQIDYLDTEDPFGNTFRQTFDVNQYLFREINDFVSIGGRFEWYNIDGESTGLAGPNAVPLVNVPSDTNIYALTGGLNLTPHPNVRIRPEIRYDTFFADSVNLAAADTTILDAGDDNQTTFGIDTIITY